MWYIYYHAEPPHPKAHINAADFYGMPFYCITLNNYQKEKTSGFGRLKIKNHNRISIKNSG
jgi:hypothetical protein